LASGKLGTRLSTGVTLYGFTHRTFYEYFSAKAIARSQEQSKEVAQHIVNVYAKDASSVLPELLIQAKEDVTERGAARVFEAVCDLGARSDLILRLMNTTLPQNTRRRGFELVCERWCDSAHDFGLPAFEALLALHLDPREQFIDDFLMASNYRWLRGRFLSAWASYGILGRSTVTTRQWLDRIAALVDDEIIAYRRTASTVIEERAADPIANWLIATGKMSPAEWPTSSLLFARAFEIDAMGAAFYSFHESLGPPSVRSSIASKLATDWAAGNVVGRSQARYIGERLNRKIVFLDIRERNWTVPVTSATVGLAMMFSEAGAPLEWLDRTLLGRGVDVPALSAYRQYKRGRAKRPDDELGQSAARTWDKLPSWAKDWSKGTHHLLKADAAELRGRPGSNPFLSSD
jgi:hypothetical protein